MDDDTTLGFVMPGLDGFRLRETVELDGEVQLTVETTTVRTGCPDCGVVARAHGRRTTVLRDLKMLGRSCRLAWAKRIWRCEERACPTRTWTERRDDVAVPRAVLTERAKKRCVSRSAVMPARSPRSPASTAWGGTPP